MLKVKAHATYSALHSTLVSRDEDEARGHDHKHYLYQLHTTSTRWNSLVYFSLGSHHTYTHCGATLVNSAAF